MFTHYANPMRDKIGKYLLTTSELVRNSCLSALSGIQITSSNFLDQHVELVNHMKESFKVFKDVNPDSSYKQDTRKEVGVTLNGKRHRMLERFIAHMCNNYPNYEEFFEQKTSSSVCDFLCKTQNGGLITIEFQVVEQDTKDDNRNQKSFFHANSICANEKEKEESLCGNRSSVLSISLIGDKDHRLWNDHFMKYFELKDRYSDKSMTDIGLIQYSLGDIDFNDPFFDNKEELKEWLYFFANAGTLQEAAQPKGKAVQEAYHLVDYDTLEKNAPDISKWDDWMANLKGHNALMIEKGEQIGLEKGRQEVEQMLLKMVKKLLNQGKTDLEICSFVEIELTKLQEIQKLLIAQQMREEQ